MARSRKRTTIDPLVSLTPVLSSNLVAPDLVRSYNFVDIGVGKLFFEKHELILKLHSLQRHALRPTVLQNHVNGVFA